MEDKPLFYPTEEAPPIVSSKELPKIEYEIKVEKNLIFNLTILKDDYYVDFIVKENEDIFKLYKKILSLQDFYDSNRIFRQYTSIDELFNLFLQKLKTSELTINKNENNIKLCFIIEYRGEKDEIPFILEQSLLKTEDIIKILCSKIKKYEKNEKKNRNKIKELETKLNEKDIIINNLIKRVDTIEQNYKELYNKSETENNNFIKSSSSNIINSVIIKDSELNLIEEGIKKNFEKSIQKYELLLRGSRDGFCASDFHSKCDEQNFTLTFIETKKGRRFGGFTEETWDQSRSWKKGPKSFVFSLDNKEIYYNKNNNRGIFCYDNENPNFCAFGNGHDFKLVDKCNESSNCYDNSGDTFDTNGKTRALSGEKNFGVKDYEVFKIYLD